MSLSGIATDLIAGLGYGGLAFGLVVDSAGVPIPSEILIPLAAALAREGRLSLAVVIIVGTIAQVLGAWISYEIARKGGVPLVKKYGKYVLFSERELAITEEAFRKYGIGLTLAGRCLPLIRTYIGYPAGLARMRRDVFLLATFLGSLVWTLLLSWLGWIVGGHFEKINAVFHKFNIIILGLLAVAFIWYVYHHVHGSRTSTPRRKN